MTTWDDKPNDYEHALAEIERLQGALETCRELRKFDRNAVIEECALMIEARTSDAWRKWAGDIATVIRALKDKP